MIIELLLIAILFLQAFLYREFVVEILNIQKEARIYWDSVITGQNIISSQIRCNCSLEKHELELELKRLKAEIKTNDFLTEESKKRTERAKK